MSSRVEKLSYESMKNDFIQRLISYRSSKILTDLKIKLGNKEFHAHKVVLMEASPVWKAMLSKEWLKEDTLELSEENFNCENFDNLLNFFYNGKIELTYDNAKSYLVSAHFLDVSNLVSSCEEFLIGELSSINAGEFYEFSSLYKLEKLKKKSLSIMTSNTYNFQNDLKILNFDIETLKNVVNDMITLPNDLQTFSRSLKGLSQPSNLIPASSSGGLFGTPIVPSSGGLFDTPMAPPPMVSSSGGLFGTPMVPSSGGLLGTSMTPPPMVQSSGGFFGTLPSIPQAFGSSRLEFGNSIISASIPPQNTGKSESNEANQKLFRMVISWVEHEPETRANYLPNLFELISFETFSIDFLKTDVIKRSLIRESHQCCLRIIEALLEEKSS